MMPLDTSSSDAFSGNWADNIPGIRSNRRKKSIPDSKRSSWFDANLPGAALAAGFTLDAANKRRTWAGSTPVLDSLPWLNSPQRNSWGDSARADGVNEAKSGPWSDFVRKISLASTQRKKNITSYFGDDPTLQKSASLSTINSINNNNQKHNNHRRSAVIVNPKDITRSLADLLSYYGTYGLEADNESFDDEEDATAAYYFLETSWTEVITDSDDTMTKKQKDQQEAIWELLATECSYIKKLRVIIKVFQLCLKNLQQDGFLLDVDRRQLFSNINEVFAANDAFWRKYLNQCVEEARLNKQPIQPSQLLDSFAKFEDLFEPYMEYCMEESQCLKYLKELTRTCEGFPEYLQWCENHKICNRLKLTDLLVKPMQRVTKYPLLLKAVLKKTSDENERLSLLDMISQVERFVSRINTALRIRHEQQKLEAVYERFESYSPVEAASDEVEKIITEMSTFDLRSRIPGLPEEEQRCVLLEGPMKMIEKQGRSDVYAFLFTDLFLLTKLKRSGEKFRVIRPPFRLNKMVLHRLKDAGSFLFSYVNEYGMLATAFVLQVNPGEQIKWMVALEKAKKFYMNARAGHGSTLDYFYDEDALPFVVSETSPMPERRDTIYSVASSEPRPSIVVSADDMNLRKHRSLSSEVSVEDHSDHAPLASEKNIKRSVSDPKYRRIQSDRRSDDHEKRRPISMIVGSTNDHDTASWVLTNDKRDRSGSIPSDLSNDSRQTSGIGDSFRSINSDSAVIQDKYRDGYIRPSNSFPEVSKVAKLKAKFERERSNSPGSTDGSSSSISTSSPAIHSDSITTTQSMSAANLRRRATPPDFSEEAMTIHEEEEHPSDDATRPSSGRSSRDHGNTLLTDRVDNDDTDSRPNDDSASNTYSESASTLTSSRQKRSFSDEAPGLVPDAPEYSERGVQVDVEPPAEVCDHEMQCEAIDMLDSFTQCDVPTPVDVEVQCEVAVIKRSDIQTQCVDFSPSCTEVATQCGDFVQLRGATTSESEDSDADPISVVTQPELLSEPPDLISEDASDNITSAHSSNTSLDTATDLPPLLKLLSTGMPNRTQYLPQQGSSTNKRPPLRPALSEASLPVFTENQVSHARSHSDGLQSQSPSRTKRAVDGECGPGMRALQTLSESLESSLHTRSMSTGSRPNVAPPPAYIDVTLSDSRSSTPNQTGNSSPSSLHRIALLKMSPSQPRKLAAQANYSPVHGRQPVALNSSPPAPSRRSASTNSPAVTCSSALHHLRDSARSSSFESRRGSGGSSNSSSVTGDVNGSFRSQASSNSSERITNLNQSDSTRMRVVPESEVVVRRNRSQEQRKGSLTKINKRNTWHFNASADNLDDIGESRSSKRLERDDRHFSKSTQVLATGPAPKKESFRRTIAKKFSDARLLDLRPSLSSQSSESNESKKQRKQEKKELKEQKKAEKRLQKEQRKLEKTKEKEMRRSTTLPNMAKSSQAARQVSAPAP